MSIEGCLCGLVQLCMVVRRVVRGNSLVGDSFDNASEVGGCSTGKSFRFVRACVRAVWLPSVNWISNGAGLSLFPFAPG